MFWGINKMAYNCLLTFNCTHCYAQKKIFFLVIISFQNKNKATTALRCQGRFHIFQLVFWREWKRRCDSEGHKH